MCKDPTILCLSACMWPAYVCQTYDALYIKHFPVSILFTSNFQDLFILVL